MALRIWTIAVIFPLLAACGSGNPECRVGADCASGICLSNGRCGTASDGGQDGADAGPDAADSTDAGPDAADSGNDSDRENPVDGGDQGPITCSPNQDGTIERSEIPIEVGLHATFRIAADAAVDTKGASQPDGSRVWDYSGALSGDHDVLVTLQSPEGQWFAADFPGATYFSALRDGQDQHGVFQATPDSLLMLGVVSTASGLTQTELTYNPPVVTLQFPIQEGNTWKTQSTVSGQAQGVYSYYFETYEYQVDAHGQLLTPFGTFPVLRVRSTLTRTVGALVTTVHSFLFVAECYGTAAAIFSQDDETAVEFTTASEVRRLSP